MILVLETELASLAEIEKKARVWGGKKVQTAVGIWIKRVGIDMKLTEIKIYRRTMKMSLHFITVY